MKFIRDLKDYYDRSDYYVQSHLLGSLLALALCIFCLFILAILEQEPVKEKISDQPSDRIIKGNPGKIF